MVPRGLFVVQAGGGVRARRRPRVAAARWHLIPVTTPNPLDLPSAQPFEMEHFSCVRGVFPIRKRRLIRPRRLITHGVPW